MEDGLRDSHDCNTASDPAIVVNSDFARQSGAQPSVSLSTRAGIRRRRFVPVAGNAVRGSRKGASYCCAIVMDLMDHIEDQEGKLLVMVCS